MTQDPMIEIDWEQGAVQRGVERYRAGLLRDLPDGGTAPRPLADLEPGQAILADVLRNAAAHVQELQRRAMSELINANGRAPAWCLPLTSLEADVMTYIAARTILTVPPGPNARDYNGLCGRIGNQLQTQREFEIWKERENSLTREAKKSGEWRPNYWHLMRTWSPDQDERAFKRWRQKSGHHDEAGWTKQMKLTAASALVTELIQHGGGWFGLQVIQTIHGREYQTKRVVVLSEAAQAWVQSRHEHNELNRPWLVPMLVPPLDWVWKEPNQETEHEPS